MSSSNNNNSYQRRLKIITSHLITPSKENLHSTNERASPKTPTRPRLLEGKVAIVTGSGQGIGKQTALLFAHEGAKIVVTDLDVMKSNQTATEINDGHQQEAISVPGDVTNKDFPTKLLKRTVERFGKVDIIVNNAGYTWDGMIHKMSDKQWQAMQDVHLLAPFRIIKAAAPFMREAAKKEIDAGKTPQDRCIINISSTSGLHGNTGQINYSAAKSGVLGMTKTIAKEWGLLGIRCNCVAFGLIDTRLTQAKTKENVIKVGEKTVALGIPEKVAKMNFVTKSIPLRRKGNVTDAAGSILLLASPYSSYITGHCLEVTGGVGI